MLLGHPVVFSKLEMLISKMYFVGRNKDFGRTCHQHYVPGGSSDCTLPFVNVTVDIL